MRGQVAAGLCAVVAAVSVTCSSPAAPSIPAPTGGDLVMGRVVRHRDGTPIAGAAVSIDLGGTGATGADGTFQASAAPAGGETRIQVTAPGYLDRAVVVPRPAPDTIVEIDMVLNAAPFLLDFYRQFARGVAPGDSLFGAWLYRWSMSPSFYVHAVVEDTGEPVPPDVVAELETVFRGTVAALSAGRLHVATFESGLEPRTETPGWVIVRFSDAVEAGRSPGAVGAAKRGGDQGYIWLRYNQGVFDSMPESNRWCRHPVVDIADHEIVHTMGFSHTTALDFRSVGCTGADRTPRALYHSEIVYSRPWFNLDPDLDSIPYDPPASPSAASHRRVEVAEVACPLDVVVRN